MVNSLGLVPAVHEKGLLQAPGTAERMPVQVQPACQLSALEKP